MILTYPELSRICRSFAMLLHSGVTLADGAFLLSREESDQLQALLADMGRALDGGSPLSDAMEQSGAFPEQLWAMVRVGEATGHTEAVLDRLGDYYETRSAVKKQLRSAVAYPGTVLCLMLLVIGVLLVKVLPVFENVYASLGRSMTGTAAGLLHTGTVLKECLPVLLCLLAILAGLAAVLYFSAKLRQRLIFAWQQRWGDRGISRKFNNAHFAQALALGLSAGFSSEDCVALAAQLLQSVPGAARRCRSCQRAMEEGAAFEAAVEEAQLLPPAQLRLLRVGIKSGSAEQVMQQIAKSLLEEAWEELERTVSSVEPTLVLVTSGLIGVILLSVMLPLVDILSVLG